MFKADFLCVFEYTCADNLQVVTTIFCAFTCILSIYVSSVFHIQFPNKHKQMIWNITSYITWTRTNVVCAKTG